MLKLIYHVIMIDYISTVDLEIYSMQTEKSITPRSEAAHLSYKHPLKSLLDGVYMRYDLVLLVG